MDVLVAVIGPIGLFLGTGITAAVMYIHYTKQNKVELIRISTQQSIELQKIIEDIRKNQRESDSVVNDRIDKLYDKIEHLREHNHRLRSQLLENNLIPVPYPGEA